MSYLNKDMKQYKKALRYLKSEIRDIIENIRIKFNIPDVLCQLIISYLIYENVSNTTDILYFIDDYLTNKSHEIIYIFDKHIYDIKQPGIIGLSSIYIGIKDKIIPDLCLTVTEIDDKRIIGVDNNYISYDIRGIGDILIGVIDDDNNINDINLELDGQIINNFKETIIDVLEQKENFESLDFKSKTDLTKFKKTKKNYCGYQMCYLFLYIWDFGIILV